MKKYLFVVCCIVIALAASRPASATTVTLTVGAGGSCATLATCDRIIGEVFQPDDFPPGFGDTERNVASIAGLILKSPGTRTGANPEYNRSTTPFIGTPPTPTETGAISGGKTDLSITLTGAFAYLIVSYDGKHAGAEVYWIAGLVATDIIHFPAFAHPDTVGNGVECGGVSQPSCGNLVADPDNYGMTNWTLANPLTGPTPTTFGTTSVPDGGTTATLLGLAMAGLGFMARRRK